MSPYKEYQQVQIPFSPTKDKLSRLNKHKKGTRCKEYIKARLHILNKTLSVKSILNRKIITDKYVHVLDYKQFTSCYFKCCPLITLFIQCFFNIHVLYITDKINNFAAHHKNTHDPMYRHTSCMHHSFIA